MELLSASDGDLEKAAHALAAGALVAFPTETVYGLGADAFNSSALARIFEAKNRPRFDPLIIHIADLASLSRIVDTAALNEIAGKRLSILAEQLWPGPLTLILPKKEEVPDLVTSGLATAAVRFPSHPVAQKLIRLSGCAVAAPSANRFGCLSPTRASHVREQLGEKVDFIIDGGRTQVGIESTVLDLLHDPPRILRPGGTSREAIEKLIGPVEISNSFLDNSHASLLKSGPIPLSQGNETALVSPGQLKSHYAPRTPLILCRREELVSQPEVPGEGRLYFSMPDGSPGGPRQPFPKNSTARTRILSETGDLCEAAANLFDMLHELDSLGLSLIRAEEAPDYGLGEAINDRLRRAEKS